MKKLFYTLLALLFLFKIEAKAQADSLLVFVHKFERFKTSTTAKQHWTASPDNPKSITYKMPNPVDVTKTFIVDPDSGLRYYPHSEKVIDPQTGYSINYDAHRYFLYHVDTKAAKIYKGKTEVKIKKLQPIKE
ncbi:hypothetical protein [Pontibacter arcticus]|uniref:Uncharacterized protein n=1 Tax=Pontibacter arcticus TaxID=2080288 RepID=A0A364RIU4_9BACT|nr:hypothetical protein [Pontibacter arcticus]RAU84146.1 hypothetical protein DP923_03620 [Pontibacter arcticus]